MVATIMANGREKKALPVVPAVAKPYRGETACPPEGVARTLRQTVLDEREAIAEQVMELLGNPSIGLPEQSRLKGQLTNIALTLAALEAHAPAVRRSVLMEHYHLLRRLLRTSALGMPSAWPDGFWETTFGQLVYIAFYDAYGEDLLLNQDVAQLLHIDLSRVGQIERLGLLDFIENPWVSHRMQRRRRVSPDMIEEYRAAEARNTPHVA